MMPPSSVENETVFCATACADSNSATTIGRKARKLQLLRREVVHGHRILKERIIARDHGDAALGDEIALAVGLGVEAYGGALGQVHVAVDDGAADAAAASNADVREQNALVDFAVGVHAHVGREDG